jgi:hypothetical protein
MLPVTPTVDAEDLKARFAKYSGRRQFCPTPKQRQKVRSMTSESVPQWKICHLLGVSSKTLRKHFRDEICEGLAEASLKPKKPMFPWSLPVSRQRSLLNTRKPVDLLPKTCA